MDEETRNKVKRIKMKISELGTKFGSNLNEENTILEFSVDELAGVPQDLVDSFEKVSNIINISGNLNLKKLTKLI